MHKATNQNNELNNEVQSYEFSSFQFSHSV